MLWTQQIQGYIYYWQGKVHEGRGLSDFVYGFITTYYNDNSKHKARFRVAFVAFNEVAKKLKFQFPQEYDAKGIPIKSSKLQGNVYGTTISRVSKTGHYEPILKILDCYKIFETSKDIADFTGVSKEEMENAKFNEFAKTNEDIKKEVKAEEQEFDLLE